ncbi:MAG: hypothetical protein JWR59_698 [Brevundimonas sp.]|nr:hypothetical protein [Brevundimonas sp.]
MSVILPLSESIRLNEIGKGLERRLEPDAAVRAKIARSLDLASLDAFVAELSLKPADNAGYRLTGRVRASAVQTCGITLEPLPVEIDQKFSVELAESVEAPENDEIEVSVDDDAPDLIEDGRIDLGQYAVEQLALNLDPFPRKPGAEFVQPEEPAEISPFAVLKSFQAKDDGEKA